MWGLWWLFVGREFPGSLSGSDVVSFAANRQRRVSEGAVLWEFRVAFLALFDLWVDDFGDILFVEEIQEQNRKHININFIIARAESLFSRHTFHH